MLMLLDLTTHTFVQEWMPEAVDAEPRRVARSKSVTDILSMLIAIYGSKELLVDEYRTLLSERLLQKAEYDTERELRTLELLKRRFGEFKMLNCEVMLKDMADSKRINNNIKAPAALRPNCTPSAADLEAAVRTFVALLPCVVRRLSLTLISSLAVQKTLEVLDCTIISALFWPSIDGAHRSASSSTTPERPPKR
jgi:hypothetical protein